MFEIILTIVAVWLCYKWLTIKPHRYPPGPPMVPILGSLPFIETTNIHYYVESIRSKHGDVIGFKFGDKNAVFVSGPLIFECLKMDVFNGRPRPVVHGVSDTFKRGIMFSNGKFWANHRRFAVRHLREFGFGKSSAETVILQEFKDFVKIHLKNSETRVQMNCLFNKSAINVLWSMIAGVRFQSDDPQFEALVQCLNRIFRSGDPTGGVLAAMPFLKHVIPGLVGYTEQLEIADSLQSYFEETIQLHRETIADEPRDLIDYYLKEMSNDQSEFKDVNCLLSACSDLFAAGTESTSNTLSYCVLYLVLYPELQQEVVEEIKQVLGGEEPSLSDRTRLPKTEAFLCEVFRCNPIAPLTVPHCNPERDVEFGGHVIPKDTMIFLSLWSLFQEADHFGDPENFRPSRFLNSYGEFIRDEYMIPFGLGKRVCIGETLARSVLFLFFVSLVQQFEIILPPGAPKPSTTCQSGFTTAPLPFEVVMKSRAI